MHRHAASNNYPMQVTAVNELTYRRRSSHRRRHHRAHGRPAPTWAACSNAVSSDARAHGPARSTSAAPRWPRRRERTFSACARAGRRLRAFSLSLSFAREVFDQSFLNVLLTSNHCTRWNFDVTSCSRRENFDVTSMVPWWRGAYGRVGESELLIDQYSVCSDFRADRNCSAAPQARARAACATRPGSWGPRGITYIVCCLRAPRLGYFTLHVRFAVHTQLHERGLGLYSAIVCPSSSISSEDKKHSSKPSCF